MLHPLQPATDQCIPRRQAFMRRRLTAARDIAQRTEDKEALAVVDFLGQHAVLATPLSEKTVAYVPPLHTGLALDEHVFVVPVIGQDMWRSYGAWWRRYAFPAPSGEASLGSFHATPSMRAIYLPCEWDLSDIWQGLSLLHEGRHAYAYMTKYIHRSDTWIKQHHWHEERDTLLMDIRILRAFGGRRLAVYLDDLLPEAKKQYAARKSQFRFALPLAMLHDPRLDGIFGAPISHLDSWARAGAIEKCMTLYLLETERPKSAMRAFLRYARLR